MNKYLFADLLAGLGSLVITALLFSIVIALAGAMDGPTTTNGTVDSRVVVGARG